MCDCVLFVEPDKRAQIHKALDDLLDKELKQLYTAIGIDTDTYNLYDVTQIMTPQEVLQEALKAKQSIDNVIIDLEGDNAMVNLSSPYAGPDSLSPSYHPTCPHGVDVYFGCQLCRLEDQMDYYEWRKEAEQLYLWLAELERIFREFSDA